MFVKGQSGNPKGRPPGSANATTTKLKEAILNAFEAVDGVQYLVRVAQEDPKTFCALLGKVLPMQVTGEGDGPLRIELVRFGDDTPSQ